MEPDASGPDSLIEVPDLLDLCRLLNAAGVHYLIYGGMACLLYGHIRATQDVDIFVGEDLANIRRALDALTHWGTGLAAQLTPEEIRDNVVVRIVDRCIIDLAARVWKLDWDTAWARRRLVTIDGVVIPVLCRQDLIESKQTYREKDAWDIAELKLLANPDPGTPAPT